MTSINNEGNSACCDILKTEMLEGKSRNAKKSLLEEDLMADVKKLHS
jgi:hypothetical protein